MSFIYVFDPIYKRRCVYVIKRDTATSLLSKHKFKYNFRKEAEEWDYDILFWLFFFSLGIVVTLKIMRVI